MTASEGEQSPLAAFLGGRKLRITSGGDGVANHSGGRALCPNHSGGRGRGRP